MALQPLRLCGSACRMMYLLRTTPPHLTQEAAECFDSLQRRAFEKIHRSTSDIIWTRATLPLSKGGLGIRLTQPLTHIAFASSHLATWQMIKNKVSAALSNFQLAPTYATNLQLMTNALSTRFNLPNHLSFQELIGRTQQTGCVLHLQQELTIFVDLAVARNSRPPTLATRAQKLAAARYESVASPEATLPFATLPRTFCYETIGPELWSTMIDLRLGAQVFSGSMLCSQCSQQHPPPYLDKFGYHASTCASGNGSTRRHNKIRDVLYSALRSDPLLFSASREWTFPSEAHLPHEQRRRLDIYTADNSLGNQPVVIDVTVVSPHNARYTSAAAVSSGAAAVKAEQTKRSKYGALCCANNVLLVPFAMDIHGALGPKATEFCKKISETSAERKGTNPSYEYQNLLLKLEVTLQKLTVLAKMIGTQAIRTVAASFCSNDKREEALHTYRESQT